MVQDQYFDYFKINLCLKCFLILIPNFTIQSQNLSKIFNFLIANKSPFPSLQIVFTLQAISSRIILDYQPDFINFQALIYL